MDLPAPCLQQKPLFAVGKTKVTQVIPKQNRKKNPHNEY